MDLKDAVGEQIVTIVISQGTRGSNYIRIVTKGHLITIENQEVCCENRFFKTEDNLADFVGAQLYKADVLPARQMRNPTIYRQLAFLEIAFLHVYTSKGAIVFEAHNQHNGNYAGMDILVEVFEL